MKCGAVRAFAAPSVAWKGGARSRSELLHPRHRIPSCLPRRAKRIDIMCQTNDGFRIAEADLKLRGPGDLEGTQQSGVAFDLKIADIARDGQLVQLARDEAQKIIDADPKCESPEFGMLWQRLAQLRDSNVNWGAIS